jgi:anti-sigma B factor antagonist
MPFSIKLDGRTVRMVMDGSIDLSITNEIKSQVEQVMSSDVASVSIDAQGLDYIDSSGVASLLFIRKLCARFGANLVFETISEPAARVIQLANLDSVLGLPKAAYAASQTSAPKVMATRIVEPRFSDADALAVFQNDSPLPQSPPLPSAAEVGIFEIKPPSFS